MMRLKIKNLKYTRHQLVVLTFFTMIPFLGFCQVETENSSLNTPDTIANIKPFKIDGVAAVVGDFIVLESDIDIQFAQLEASGINTKDITRCQLFGKLLEDKLYMHHSIQDSLEVNDLEIKSYVDQQLESFAQQIGSMEKLVAYYNKGSEQELRDEMFALNKNGKMAAMMQQKIIEEVEVTPEEVRQFFNGLPKSERPVFGTELRVAQIVVIPETTEAEIKKVINKLNDFRSDIIDNGASFTTKAVLYTEDPGSKSNGGKYTLNRSQPNSAKEFREVVFSLEVGEISEPFKTDFGYHIVLLEKIRGQEYDVRHILLKPKITNQSIKEARDKINRIRESIVNGELSFSDAAKEGSDEKETKYDGGQLRNPETQDYNFELTKMDPELYSQIQNLADGDVSPVYKDEDRTNSIKFKILTVTNRVNEHEADFAQDYIKIKALALEEKQLEAIADWQEEKIKETFISINENELRACDFQSNWLNQ